MVPIMFERMINNISAQLPLLDLIRPQDISINDGIFITDILQFVNIAMIINHRSDGNNVFITCRYNQKVGLETYWAIIKYLVQYNNVVCAFFGFYFYNLFLHNCQKVECPKLDQAIVIPVHFQIDIVCIVWMSACATVTRQSLHKYPLFPSLLESRHWTRDIWCKEILLYKTI